MISRFETTLVTEIQFNTTVETTLENSCGRKSSRPFGRALCVESCDESTKIRDFEWALRAWRALTCAFISFVGVQHCVNAQKCVRFNSVLGVNRLSNRARIHVRASAGRKSYGFFHEGFFKTLST
jgi:hypothetical protein